MPMHKLSGAALAAACLFLSFTPALACGSAAGHGSHGGSHTSHQGHHQEAETDSILGKVSLCASYMHMNMDGTRDGTDDLSVLDVAALGYEMVPTEMTMDMVMFGVGVQPLDWLDLSIETQFMRSDMKMIHDPLGHTHDSAHNTGGHGDTSIGAGARVYTDGPNTVRVSLGISLPTGSIDEKGVHGDPDIHSPYDMQLGTGTYDLLPGIAFDTAFGPWSYGTSIGGRVHLGKNGNGYSWGDKITAGVNAGYRVRDWLQLTASLNGEHSGEIDGEDEAVTQDMPTGNADFYGGTVVMAGAGLNIFPPGTNGTSHALTFQVDMPVYQNYNGPHMKSDYNFTIGWNTRF